MIIISIDLETTGIDPENNQILEFAAIIEDTEKKLGWDEIPKFQRILKSKSYTGSPFAINLNQRIFNILSESDKLSGFDQVEYDIKNNIIHIDYLPGEFLEFLRVNGVKGSLNIAGKNFGTFDKLFLDKVQGWKDAININRRIIDPTVLFVDWNSDKSLPSLDECKKRAGLGNPIVSHEALSDAWDIIQILRTKY